jgi:hypothetical protein
MTRPKHERIQELMMDAMWNLDNTARSITDPARMNAVLQVVIDLLRLQPSMADEDGCLAWAARWLEKRLQEDTEQ